MLPLSKFRRLHISTASLSKTFSCIGHDYFFQASVMNRKAYFDSEKRAYLSLGLKIYPEARIIQPYQAQE
jgi:hypothetical protein